MNSKKDINERLKELEKIGWLVFNFSFNKYIPKGIKGLPDYLLINYKRIVFLELKLKETKDKLREHQKIIKNKIEKYGFEYYIINENNINDVINKLIEI
jgi:predicted type IV restriction endonuclease